MAASPTTAPGSSLAAPPSRGRPGAGPVRRAWAVARAADRALAARLGAQLAKVSAWLIGLGYAVAMLLLARGTGGALLDVLVIDALGWLSWLTAGLVALSVAAAAKDPESGRGLESLALARGFSLAVIRDARGLAALRRVVRLTLGPALALALLALVLSGSPGLLAARLLLCLGVGGYVLVLALVLGGLAHIAATLAPRHGRSLLLLLVFAPHLARGLWPHVPSVPWLLGWLLDRLRALGGLAT